MIVYDGFGGSDEMPVNGYADPLYHMVIETYSSLLRREYAVLFESPLPFLPLWDVEDLIGVMPCETTTWSPP